jgi:hypothetical protein
MNKRAVAVSITSLLEGLMVRDYADQSLVDLEKDYLAMTKIILDGIMARNSSGSNAKVAE